jgi:hypothetical protein
MNPQGGAGSASTAGAGTGTVRNSLGQVVNGVNWYLDSLDRSKNEFRGVDQGGYLRQTGNTAGEFADRGEAGFNRLGGENAATRRMLQDQATGKVSLSGEQLRQGLAQNVAGQASMAAGARGGNQAMAARQAAMNAGRAGSALTGQQALAGIQERNAAVSALGQMQMGQRAMELQAALGARGQQLGAYGDIEDSRTQRFNAMMGNPTKGERVTSMVKDVGQGLATAFSDRRLKKEIKSADSDASEFLKGLKAYSYKYKNSEHGEGDQLGVMAQDLERTKFGKQAVIDTPEGKMVHGAKLAGALAAATSSMNRRLEKLEKKG